MMFARWPVLILFLLTNQPLVANQFSTEQVITSLQQKGKIPFSLLPTLHAYQDLCPNINPSNLDKQMVDICNVVLKSPICKDIPKEKQLNCKELSNQPKISAWEWEFLKGCTKGVLNSIKNFLRFMWEIMRWAWKNATSSEQRSKTAQQVNEYSNSIKLYLNTEYEKAYDKTSPPFRSVKALKSMAGSLADLVIRTITDLLSQKYQEMGCLNTEAKSEMLCQFLGEIFIPPVAAISLIKYGPKAIKQFPNLKNAFAKNKTLFPNNSRRIAEAEYILNRTIPDHQRKAIIKAHNVGKGQKGVDGSFAKIGNYTPAQLRQKAKLLKKAGLNSDEIRQLMEKGIVGLAPQELKTFSRLPAQAPNISLGEKVAIPRTGGGYSNAKIVGMHFGKSARVSFVDADGVLKRKTIDISQVRPPINVPHVRIGESVSVPRTGGQWRSNGTISKVKGDKTRVDFVDENGKEVFKWVLTRDLKPPVEKRTMGNERKVIKPAGVPDVRPREKVSVPRTNGEHRWRSNGTISKVKGEKTRVDFVDEKGQEVFKWVLTRDLKPPVEKGKGVAYPTIKKASPPFNRREVVISNGGTVSVPRTSGGFSNAKVADVDGRAARVIFTDTDGALKEKVVDISRVKDPINVPHVRIGESVSVPRTGGQWRSNGTISKVKGDKARVDFVDENGNEVFKWVSVHDLKPTIKQKLPPIVAKNDLTPRHSIPVNGGNIKVGEFFQDSGGRVFTIAEVNINGKITHQLFYRSNSQAVFRMMPARNKGLAYPGYDKGIGEHTLTVPPTLQAALTKKLNAQNPQTMPVMKTEDLDGVIPVNRSLEDYKAYRKSSQYVDERFVQTNPILRPTPRTLSDGYGREISPPKNITINKPELKPDYRRPSQSYEINSPLYGKVQAYVYKSKDGTMEYTLLRDQKNRVWFGDIGKANTSLTPHGLRTQAIDAEELMTPLWEYFDGIPKGYFNGEVKGKSYGSAWNYIREIPEIQRWYRENGIAIPK